MTYRAACLALFLSAVTAPPLAAQETTVNIGSGERDTSLPVEVTSDTLSIENEAGIAIFEGNVIVIQGTMRLKAPKVRVEYSDNEADATTDIDVMIATGGVVFVDGPDAAEGEMAVYRPDEGDLVMTGDVVLTQERSVVAGERLVVDMDTGEGVMSGGRVRSIFQSENN